VILPGAGARTQAACLLPPLILRSVNARLDDDIVSDLLRSAWIIESARTSVYREWGDRAERFFASGERARQRADLIERALEARATKPDRALVEPHAEWVRRCALGPDEPLADLFLVRMADWVDAHALDYLPEGQQEMGALSDAERASLLWPSGLPPPPPFEPLPPPPGSARPDRRLRVGVLGDTHVGSPLARELAVAAVEDLNASGADVVVQLGDLTDHGDPHEFAAAASVLDGIGAPLLTMMGNHDVYSAGERRLAGRELYRTHFGREPEGRLEEIGGVRLAVLDSAEHGISPFPPFDLVSGAFAEGGAGALVRGALSAPQHDILAEIAAPGAAGALVFLHHPPQPFTGFPPVIFGLRDADSGRLHATCDSGNVWGVFAGHTHRNHRGTGFDGVPVQEVAAPCNYPCGFGLIDVHAAGFEYRFEQISNEDLLRLAHERAAAIQRRYARGTPEERAFSHRADATQRKARRD